MIWVCLKVKIWELMMPVLQMMEEKIQEDVKVTQLLVEKKVTLKLIVNPIKIVEMIIMNNVYGYQNAAELR